MATKKCANGHQYDSSIYGENCPFCPSSGRTKVETVKVNQGGTDVNMNERTHVVGGNDTIGTVDIGRKETLGATPDFGGATVIRHLNPTGGTGVTGNGNRRLVAVLVSYDHNKMGEAYMIYEGRNLIGRAANVDIPFPADSNMSSQHLLIHYVDAEGVFWAVDQHSSNGTYINGAFVRGDVALNTNDIIVIGGTKLVFMAIPQ